MRRLQAHVCGRLAVGSRWALPTPCAAHGSCPGRPRAPGDLASRSRRCSGAAEAAPQRRLSELLSERGGRRFVFVGGKGGVGKTSTAAALALGFARHGKKTLVVSTDPAHSLGDALAMGLSGEPTQVSLDGLASEASGSLHGMEIDPTKVVERMRAGLRVDTLRQLLEEGKGGLGTSFLSAVAQAGVDLESLASLLEQSPPGIDEAVALGHLMMLLQDEQSYDFDCVVIDTAPTGHTLRMLAFPRFLHTMIGTLLSIQEKVAAFSSFSSFLPIGNSMGSVLGEDFGKQLRNTKENLERMMASMASVERVLEDAKATTFVVVAIPTHLAVAESRRLLAALREARMPARHVVMNQVPFISDGGDGIDADSVASATAKLDPALDALDLASRELQAIRFAMSRLQRQCTDAEKQIAVLDAEVGADVQLIRVPTFDTELCGIAALDNYASVLSKA